MKILCINTRKGIGDQIIFLSYYQAISKKFQTPISLLAKENSKAKQLFANDKYINEIITLEEDMDGIKGMFKLTKILKKESFDKVFIFNGSIRYKLIAIFAGIKNIYQYPLFISKDIIFQTAKVFTETHVGKILSTEPNLYLKDDDVSKAKKTYNINEQTISIVLGCGASGPTKKWPVDNYIKLITKLNNYKKCKFFVVAGKSDIEIINKIKLSKINSNCITLENLSISNILPIIKNCNLYIGNDTGFMHISAALGVKSIGIFVDSPAYAYSGYSKNIIPIVPEGETVESVTHDSLGKNRISLDEVLSAAKKFLA